MNTDAGKEIVILGVTSEGRTFRPSNWAERLAGVMSVYRPRALRPGDHVSYSPWCMPSTENGVKCLRVQLELRTSAPEAWQYLEQFARDNDLQIREPAHQ